MAEYYFKIPEKDRRWLLAAAATKIGLPAAQLEKDIWIVWCLQKLFGAFFAAALVFKGGTSLSKAFMALIERFSEDVDIACDIHYFAPDLANEILQITSKAQPQINKLPVVVRKRLKSWISGTVVPLLEKELAKTDPLARITVRDRVIYLLYPSVTPLSPYVKKEIKLEFSPCVSKEHSNQLPVICDLARSVENLELPHSLPQVMNAERTFWEKVAAVHAFCKQQRMSAKRFARHSYDIAQLDSAGIGVKAVGNKELVETVAINKAMLYREKDREGKVIDFHDTVISGKIQLIPSTETRLLLKEDYIEMVQSKMVTAQVASELTFLQAGTALSLISV